MGMDVHGKNNGAYFRRSVWGWHPLADLVCRLAPDLTSACKRWHTNDGDGLEEPLSLALAARLRAALKDGTVTALVAHRNTKLAAIPDEICAICSGTGVRSDDIGRQHNQHLRIIDQADHPRHGETGWCNGCEGRGKKRPFATWYRVSVDDVREFADFLERCGGFSIC